MRIINIKTGIVTFYKDIFPDSILTTIELEQLGYEVYQIPTVEVIKVEDPIEQLVKGLEAYYDSIAMIRKYDNRITCVIRAGYVGPFQGEGIDFASWMDYCNEKAYIVINENNSLTIEELISVLPTPPW